MKPRNIKEANKDAKIYVGRSPTVHNLLFYAHTLCMNYVIKAFLYWLVPLTIVNNNCVLCKRTKSNNKEPCRFSIIPLYEQCFYQYHGISAIVHIFHAYKGRQLLLETQIDCSFLCAWPVIDDKLLEPRVTGEWFRSKL